MDDNVSGDVSQPRERDDAANESVKRARSCSSLAGGVLSERETGEVVAAAAARDADSASSRVQAAAAASVSSEVYECLGEETARAGGGGQQDEHRTDFREDDTAYRPIERTPYEYVQTLEEMIQPLG